MTLGPLHISTSGEYISKNDASPDWPAWNVCEMNMDSDQHEAHARLFAAAPDLLDALEALGAFTRDLLRIVTPEQIKQARLTTRMLKVNDQAFNALAKARGE